MSGWEYGGKKDLESKRKARERTRRKGYTGKIESIKMYTNDPPPSAGAFCLLNTMLIMAAPTALVALAVKAVRR